MESSGLLFVNSLEYPRSHTRGRPLVTPCPWTHHGHPPLQVVDVVLLNLAHRIENPGIVSGYGWLVSLAANGLRGEN